VPYVLHTLVDLYSGQAHDACHRLVSFVHNPTWDVLYTLNRAIADACNFTDCKTVCTIVIRGDGQDDDPNSYH
jgi:hypothetical protein